MQACSPVRAFLYICLFVFSVILLGLSGYRVHYTETLHNGDILTTRTSFYDPIIVELVVTSCLAIIFSLWLTVAIFARIRNIAGSFLVEHLMIWTIWIMFLVGAAITTHNWPHLNRCRGHNKVCRILETITAIAWICWSLLSIIILCSIGHMAMEKLGPKDPISGESTRQPRGADTFDRNTTHQTRQVNNNAQTDSVPVSQGPVTPVVAPNPAHTTGDQNPYNAPTYPVSGTVGQGNEANVSTMPQPTHAVV